MPLEMLPAAIRAELDGFRTREAGKFVTRLYEERARRDERGPGAR
jgi:hypothetical protein